MVACGSGGGNSDNGTATGPAASETKKSTQPPLEMMEGITKLQRETIKQIGKTTETKVVLESRSTTFEEEKYMVYDFSGCGPEGTNSYLNYLFFIDKDSYDEWQNKEKPKVLKSTSLEIISEDRDGLLVVYRHTLGYKMSYEDATNFGKIIK